MVDWLTPDENGRGGDAGYARAPRLGFQEAWVRSQDAQYRANSLLAIESEFSAAEEDYLSKARTAGVNVKRLYDYSSNTERDGMSVAPVTDYLAVARYLQGETDAPAGFVQSEIEREALKEKYPEAGFRTLRETWTDIRTNAQKAERSWNQSETNLLGMVGGFLGGAVAGMDPRTDPLNAITAPIGGIGKTLAVRVASQGFGQGVIEAINQVTGVQEGRRLLGLDTGPGQAIGAALTAAAGGAALQGIGEGLGAIGRRWFVDSAADPAPAPPVDGRSRVVGALRQRGTPAPEPARVPSYRVSYEETPIIERVDLMSDFDAFRQVVGRGADRPYGATPAARERTAIDLDFATRQLDAMDGPRPWELAPNMDTRPAPRGVGVRVDTYNPIARMGSLDDIARTVDPDTFRVYDKLTQQIERTRSRIRDTATRETQDLRAGAAAEVDAQLAMLEGRVARLKGKPAARMQERIDALRETRKAQFGDKPIREAPSDLELRQTLQRMYQQQRDLAPMVSRAYSAAKNKWDDAESLDPDAIEWMRKNTNDVLRPYETVQEPVPRIEADAEVGFNASKVTVFDNVVDDVPMIASRPDIVAKLGPDADAADAIAAIVAEEAKIVGEGVDEFMTQVPRVLADGSQEKLVLSDGTELDLNARMFVAQDEGDGLKEISVREFLADLDDDAQVLRAATTCAVRPQDHVSNVVGE